MGSIKIQVDRVQGRRANGDGEFFNDFEALDLPWKERGFTYCWIDKHPRSLGKSRIRGWQICDLQRDFLDKGCPEESVALLPSQSDGTITFHDVVLAKMPISLYQKRISARRELADQRKRARKDVVNSAADQLHSAMRRQGKNVPEGGVVQWISGE